MVRLDGQVTPETMDFCDRTSSDYCIRQPIMVHVLHYIQGRIAFESLSFAAEFEHISMFVTGALFEE